MTILKINLSFTYKIAQTVKKVIIPIYTIIKISMELPFISKKKQHLFGVVLNRSYLNIINEVPL